MRKEIKALEKQAKILEPDTKEREFLRNSVVNYTERFLQEINLPEKSPAFQVHNKGIDLLNYPISDEPLPMEKVVEVVKKNVDQEGINPASGGHLGYIPGGGIYTASLGDYWAAITNRYVGVFFASAGAVRMENHLINWMKELIGYPAEALGNLASGGSIANLTAIVTARDAYEIKAAEVHRQVIYLSRQAHHCIDKAINIAGLRECQVRFIDTDEHYRMNIQHLRSALEKDTKAGLRPWLLIGSAGTTDTGAIDPLPEMADIATAHGLWFHVDAAYGGFFILTDEGAPKLKGIERAHSVVMDPHKGLFLPYGLGVVLVRNGEQLRKSFVYQASYMQDTANLVDEISPADISPELSKHFRGLRMWLPLMVHGMKPFKAALAEKLLLTRYAYQQLAAIEDVERGPEPDLSVIVFRFIPKKGDSNAVNKAVINKIHEDGRVFLSSTTIDGVYFMRLAILAFRLHLETIDLALEIVKEKYAEVKQVIIS